VQGGAGKDMLIGGLGGDNLDGGAGTDILFDGTVALANPTTDSLQKVLAVFAPTKRPVLVDLSNRLTVTSDDTYVDSLTGGAGTDWFWSVDGLDVLDTLGTEPKNKVFA
jgi:Ca2+-binding RTX toxin-like protein